MKKEPDPVGALIAGVLVTLALAVVGFVGWCLDRLYRLGDS